MLEITLPHFTEENSVTERVKGLPKVKVLLVLQTDDKPWNGIWDRSPQDMRKLVCGNEGNF